MNRKLLAVGMALLLVVATYAGASFYAGMRIQAETDRAVEMLNAHLSRKWSDQIQISQSSYSRGIFSSTATYVLTFPSSKDPSIRPEIIFTNQIEHGPLPARALMQGQFSPMMAILYTTIDPNPYTQAVFTALGGKPLMNGYTRLDMQGIASLNWTAPAVQYAQEEFSTQFGGASLKATIGADFSSSKGTLTIDSLMLGDSHSSIDLQGVTVQTDTRIGSFDLNIGTSQASVDRLTMTRPDKSTFTFEKLNSQLKLNEKASMLDGQVSYEAGAILINQQNWGKLSLTASYAQLDGTALKSLIDLNNSLLTRSLTNAPESDLLTTADLKQFWLGVQALLKSSPTFNINPLLWITPEGESTFNLNTAFTPAETTATGMGLASNPISSVKASLEVSRPMVAGLIAQSNQQSGMTAAQVKTKTEREIKSLLDIASQIKIGKLEGEKFVSRLTFEKNVLTVNERAIPLKSITDYLYAAMPADWLFQETPSKQDKPDESVEIKHLDPSVLATILTAADFNFEQVRDEQGDPLLKVSPGNSGAAKIDISFIGCGADPTCEDVLLRATYSPNKPVALQVANDWNIRNRWARAYVNDKNEAVIEMDISAYGGIGRDALEAMVSTFFKIVGDFSKDLKDAK